MVEICKVPPLQCKKIKKNISPRGSRGNQKVCRSVSDTKWNDFWSGGQIVAKFSGSAQLLTKFFWACSLDPRALRVRAGPWKGPFLPNLSPPRVRGRRVVSYLFGNGKTRQKNVASGILIYGLGTEKMGPEGRLARGPPNFEIFHKWDPYQNWVPVTVYFMQCFDLVPRRPKNWKIKSLT